MSAPTFARPQLTILSEDQKLYTHEQSLLVLEKAGVRMDSARARELVEKRLGASVVRGDRVYFPREIVDWALSVAPHTIRIHDRLGEPKFTLGEPGPHFGIGVTNLYYQDPMTDEVSPFLRQHMEKGVRLGHVLPNYDVVSTLGVLRDYDPDIADAYAVLEMTANTTKPLVLLISLPSLFPASLDMLEHLHGDLSAKPYLLPYFNPVSPLIVNEDTVEKMFVAIERGIPFIYSNYGMAGMSTPITPAGTMAMLNAELLAGLTVTQIIKEGASIALGSLPAYFDMKTMIEFYDPYTILIDLAVAEMMEHYRLPHMGTSGSGSGWGPDLIESGVAWLNHVASSIGHAGLMPFVGGTLGSMAFSPAYVVLAHDIIGKAKHFAQGFQLDDESVGLSEIESVGPGGNFVLTDSTLKMYKGAHYHSDIFPNLSLDRWQSEGMPNATTRLREATVALLESARPPDDHDELIEKGEKFISTIDSHILPA
jgi:trimethylamine--corrinoid protein Co-methyltransferase